MLLSSLPSSTTTHPFNHPSAPPPISLLHLPLYLCLSDCAYLLRNLGFFLPTPQLFQLPILPSVRVELRDSAYIAKRVYKQLRLIHRLLLSTRVAVTRPPSWPPGASALVVHSLSLSCILAYTPAKPFITMSGKLDQSLDEITTAQRRSSRRRSTQRRSTGRPAAAAPVGGVQKTTKPARGAAAKPALAKAAAANADSKIIVSNLVSHWLAPSRWQDTTLTLN